MKKSVKKGFTLVEVVAALAILTTSILIIYQVFDFSSKIWVKEKNNIDLTSYSQTIAQTLKSAGKDHLKEIYDNGAGANVYIYFDSGEDAAKIVSGVDMTSFMQISDTSDIYSKNSNKIYGAQLLITEEHLSTAGYAVYSYYQVQIKVWKLDKLDVAPSGTPEISTVATLYIT